MTEVPISLYDTFMLPLELLGFTALRDRWIGRARGKVLELGAGTGVNLAHYRQENLRELTLTDLDPDEEAITRKLRKRGFSPDIDIMLLSTAAERLPFADDHFDSVVATLLLCSVEDPHKALSEIRRVLVPGGSFFFIEHIRPEKRIFGRLSEWVTPLWRRIGSGCRLDRRTDRLIADSGFFEVEAEYAASGVVFAGRAIKKTGRESAEQESPVQPPADTAD